MGLLDSFAKKAAGSLLRGAIDYGKQKKNCGHDHRHNCGEDRTPAQKAGDQKHGKAKSD